MKNEKPIVDEFTTFIKITDIKAGYVDDDLVNDCKSILINAEIHKKLSNTRDLKVKIPAPSIWDFIFRRQKTVKIKVEQFQLLRPDEYNATDKPLYIWEIAETKLQKQ